MLAWLWVAVPVLGWLPGAPVRLSAQWLSLLVSIVVIGVGLSRPCSKTPFGWLSVACLGLACLAFRHPTAAFLWACQVSLVLTSATVLVGQARDLRHAVLACAWVQVLILGLQLAKVPGPWPLQPPPNLPGGTVGSIRPASILMGVASLWSTGWPAWGLGAMACLTGSGTVMPVILLRRWWPCRRTWWGGVVGVGGLVAVAPLAQRWVVTLSERAQVWASWPLTWTGLGFRAFPGGFADDTAFGRAMQWRDSHNVLLDWVGRFGLPGFLVMAGVGWWVWRRTPDPWTLGCFLWVACWQSLEQFPVLVMPLLVWLIGLAEGGTHVDSV